jgi:hypothetical protein
VQSTVTQTGVDLITLVSQNGSGNSLRSEQSAASSTVHIWQQPSGFDNSLVVGQGTGNATQSVNGAAPGGATGANANNLGTRVTQGGSLNSTTVNQDGASLQTLVGQLGTGLADPNGTSGTAGTFQNLILVQQTGSNQFASAYQAPTVGPSNGSSGSDSDPASGPGLQFGFAGGRRSAEITILQSNAGNSATVEQFGRGQVARVEQSGTGGVAKITQGLNATNATAVIQQAGINNNYTILQTQPGQYIQVTQTGTGNGATIVTAGPPH